MKKRKAWFAALPVLILFTAGIGWFVRQAPVDRDEIVITVPYNEYIRSMDTNYYKLWLEEQTGLSIRFNIIRDAHSVDYLRSMFASGYVKSDAFFSILDGADFADWNTVLQEFGEKGYLLPLNDYVEQSVHLNAVFEDFEDYDLRQAMTSADGNIYYIPGFDPSMPESHFQVLWLNEGWMKTLRLRIPQTTEELRKVLYAFKTEDPNGNGIMDEIPLAGSSDIPGEQLYNLIINAFIYNNPDNSRLFVEDGAVRFAPVTNEWREAMKYLRSLYDDGLIDPFSYQHSVLTGLANDSWNMLGGFTSRSVTDILFQTNPELINSFTHIAPIAGPAGIRNATVRTPLPRPAGVIPSSCKNPEAVFQLFDLMLSENAFLIGRYGEENVDWIPAHGTDMDSYGNKATVRVVNQLRNTVQNKHICEIGPFFAYPQYADGVTFSGFDADQEYVNARAYRVYEQYKPAEYINTILLNGEYPEELQDMRKAIDDYTDKSIRAFMTGEKDPFDDSDWQSFVRRYSDMGVDSLIDAAQTAYDNANEQEYQP